MVLYLIINSEVVGWTCGRQRTAQLLTLSHVLRVIFTNFYGFLYINYTKSAHTNL